MGLQDCDEREFRYRTDKMVGQELARSGVLANRYVTPCEDCPHGGSRTTHFGPYNLNLLEDGLC